MKGVSPAWGDIFINLAVPTWLIFGELSLPDADEAAMRQQGVAVKILPDAGHSMSLENPSGLAKILAECMG